MCLQTFGLFCSSGVDGGQLQLETGRRRCCGVGLTSAGRQSFSRTRSAPNRSPTGRARSRRDPYAFRTAARYPPTDRHCQLISDLRQWAALHANSGWKTTMPSSSPDAAGDPVGSTTFGSDSRLTVSSRATRLALRSIRRMPVTRSAGRQRCRFTVPACATGQHWRKSTPATPPELNCSPTPGSPTVARSVTWSCWRGKGLGRCWTDRG